MSDSEITPPALCSAPTTDEDGREYVAFFETRERPRDGEWIAAQRTLEVQGR